MSPYTQYVANMRRDDLTDAEQKTGGKGECIFCKLMCVQGVQNLERISRKWDWIKLFSEKSVNVTLGSWTGHWRVKTHLYSWEALYSTGIRCLWCQGKTFGTPNSLPKVSLVWNSLNLFTFLTVRYKKFTLAPRRFIFLTSYSFMMYCWNINVGAFGTAILSGHFLQWEDPVTFVSFSQQITFL